jgi:hypothetical protein
MNDLPGCVEVEGNNGGDYLKIISMGGDEIYLEVGHCCVVSFRGIIPVQMLTALISQRPMGVDMPWDEETNHNLAMRAKVIPNEELDDRVWKRLRELTPKKKGKLEIHNRVTKKQLALKPGDQVEVTLDDGTKEMDCVTHEPTKLGGHTWVAWLGNHGSYALCRCKPIKVVPAGAGK